jgi:hypothetical protein
MLKSAYRWISAIALVHLIVLGGGIGFLVSTGRLDADQARKIADVLKGEADAMGDDVGEPDAEQDDASTPIAIADSDQQRAVDEIAWRNAERYKTQLDQRQKFIQRERLDVDRRREEFERSVKREREREKAEATRRAEAGYAKELEILSALSPKSALKQVMAMDDVEAAQVLFRLETRKVKKIFEAAKSGEQLARMTQIRRLIRDVKPTGASEE